MIRRISIFCALLVIAQAVSAEPHQKTTGNNIKTENHAFVAGEKLTYNISWSNILQAGTSVMEVRDERTADNRPAYRVISAARSSQLVSAFYPVMDTVQSVMDARELCSLSYSLSESHGGKKRRKEMVFDHENGTVRIVTNGSAETFSIPDHVQDALSSLYYLRTRDDFVTGKAIIIDVHEGGKNWSVEVQTLGRERLKTALGEFNTIKVKTYPKYDGVFQHKGEIFIWLTDDARKIPVLMKSTITIGSIVAALTELRTGEEK